MSRHDAKVFSFKDCLVGRTHNTGRSGCRCRCLLAFSLLSRSHHLATAPEGPTPHSRSGQDLHQALREGKVLIAPIPLATTLRVQDDIRCVSYLLSWGICGGCCTSQTVSVPCGWLLLPPLLPSPPSLGMSMQSVFV